MITPKITPFRGNDIDLLNRHRGKKYLMWGGNDALFESKAFYLNYLKKDNFPFTKNEKIGF